MRQIESEAGLPGPQMRGTRGTPVGERQRKGAELMIGYWRRGILNSMNASEDAEGVQGRRVNA